MKIHVNGRDHDVDAPATSRLLDVLRLTLGLTGTKEGCGEGECGSCTVFLDDLPVNACLVLLGQVEARKVTTVEALSDHQHLAPIQKCFVEDGGAQCGICTPGMIVSAEALLRANTRPSDADIREAIAGNICRCTGYQRIVDAIRHAAEVKRGSVRPRKEAGK